VGGHCLVLLNVGFWIMPIFGSVQD